MPGAPLSRFTMSYFAVSIACLLLALLGMTAGFGYPSDSLAAPDTLVIVHLLTIGWLGLLFCGALLQFVPVLSAAAPRLTCLSAPALILLIIGLAALLAGFLALGGRLNVDLLIIMPVGALSLAAGFVCLSLSFVWTMLSQRSVDHSGWMVLIGLISLLVTIMLGASFTGLLSGTADLGGVPALLEAGVSVHALSGLLGWMSITAAGVSYRLFSMFMVAPATGLRTRPLLASIITGLGVLWFGPFVENARSPVAASLPWASLALLACGMCVFFSDIAGMVRARRRKTLELSTLLGLCALGYLPFGFALLTWAAIAPQSETVIAAVIYVLAMGWFSGLGLSQLYKIVPFLTWLETYGPVMGHAPVPRVQDLIRDRRARLWFILYHAGVVVGLTALLADALILFRMAAGLQLVAVTMLALEFIRARRLAYAPKDIGLPSGTVRPHLFYAHQT
ncbi:hypothetical protein ACQKGC_01880 [Allorhizobium pseudoryzae]|uniref:hypothetical protein n=1 Tax=Allorhizobium pseudoryzae TaxID=379684 RepID=UPI003D052EE6